MTTLHVMHRSQKLKLTGIVHDVSIPLNFNQAQPNHFGAKNAVSEPMTSGSFTGDTRQGGSCNAESITLNPHCNGTHTECVGHLTLDRVAIRDHAPALPLLAAVITLTPETTNNTTNEIGPEIVQGALCALNQLPTLDQAVSDAAPLNSLSIRVLLIRTEPNGEQKLTHRYQGSEDTPYFSPQAIKLLVDAGIEHLLVDVPSLDPYHDGGQLEAHRVFFGLPSYAKKPQVEASDASRSFVTITEMIYLSSAVPDDLYLLNLQLPSFNLDAAPSRPLLYALEREDECP